MNSKQTAAVTRIQNWIGRNSIRFTGDANRYGKQITNLDVKDTDYGTVTVSLQVESLGLPENNLLRVIDHEFWLFFIGKRGAITARMYPKSLDQFKGRQYLGINIR